MLAHAVPARPSSKIPSRETMTQTVTDVIRYDINCDLGEGEPARKTKELMRHITSANLACGGHAGTLRSMTLAVREAIAARVNIGAHPGLIDREKFGRGNVEISTEMFETLLVQQISALQTVALAEGGKLHHVKLHGALYHWTDANAAFRGTFISVMQRFWPRVIVFARAGGKTASTASEAGLTIWSEGFLDRNYLADGSLAPRGDREAVLGLKEFEERVASLARGISPVHARAGMPVRTWCVHSDTPHAIKFACLAKQKLFAKDRPQQSRFSRG